MDVSGALIMPADFNQIATFCNMVVFWLGCFFMVFNTTFNNISVTSWQSVLLLEEMGVPRENHWPAVSHWKSLSHNVLHLAMSGIRTILYEKVFFYDLWGDKPWDDICKSQFVTVWVHKKLNRYYWIQTYLMRAIGCTLLTITDTEVLTI